VLGDERHPGCEEFIAESEDGKAFMSTGEEALLEERDGSELGDIECPRRVTWRALDPTEIPP
jgi:hypothetical protein